MVSPSTKDNKVDMGRRFSILRGATRVVFGARASEGILAEIEAMGAERVLVVCSSGRKADAAALAQRLGSRSVGVLATAREHVPIETVNAARVELDRCKADAVFAFGGGSATGLAKAMALTGGVRVLAVPTTYSGSEMTPIYGITEDGNKRTGRDERTRPLLVVYDPVLTWGLPRETTVTSLWNAMAHAVEALWAKDVDRATQITAEEALRLLATSLERLAVRLDDEGAREDALEGAYLAGVAFADAGGGLHHKLCHLLGGMFGLPHAATHAVLLPHVVRFYREAAPEAMCAIARALGVMDPVFALERLARATVPLGFSALGMPRDGLTRVVEAVLASPSVPHSPRPLDRGALEELLAQAFTATPAKAAAPPLRGPETTPTQPGFGSTHESEGLPGALPRRQNTPRPAPYGLYPELLNGTPFTVKNAENSRVWMYRVRAGFSHSAFMPLLMARFTSAFEGVNPNRTRWRPMPIPAHPARVDFIDGLVTLGGAGDPVAGPGYAVHLYAANADMEDRSFSSSDGDLLIVPQEGTLECRTELGWLRVSPGSIALVPRALKFAIGIPEGAARGWMLEVQGSRLRLPERGPIGSNGLADARHFLAPTASYEDRVCPSGFQIVNKLGGQLHAAMQEHSPFDVVAWHGNHVPFTYDLSLFNAMGSVTFDHPDPSILTVLTAPLDDHGRAVADFVVFPGRWEVSEHSFRPPFMHRNAASEINCVVRTPSPDSGYDPGCTFISPLLTSHGISTKSYDHVLDQAEGVGEAPRRLPDGSLWTMFESALPFRASTWARETSLVDAEFSKLFDGMRRRFDPTRP